MNRLFYPMEEKLRKLQQRTQLLSSRIDDPSAASFQVRLTESRYDQTSPRFIQSLAQKAKFGEEEPKESLRDNAFAFPSSVLQIDTCSGWKMELIRWDS